jgi:hypothetical protein
MSVGTYEALSDFPDGHKRMHGSKQEDATMLDWAHWYDGTNFTTDWTTCHFETWSAIFAPLQHREIEILEIGSWEGRSATFFLEFLGLSRLTCIDTFLGSPEHVNMQVELASIEKRFDENTAGYRSRVEKIKSRSVLALDRMAQDGRSYDIIY